MTQGDNCDPHSRECRQAGGGLHAIPEAPAVPAPFPFPNENTGRSENEKE